MNRKLTPARVEKIVREAQARGETPDLVEADLRGLDLSGANLNRANLSQANLSQANLFKADLDQANLTAANLSQADLRTAYLGAANLSLANLSQVRLGRASLLAADLSGADLSMADLSEATLHQAKLGGADLSGAILERANLSLADLGGADLSQATVGYTIFADVDLGVVNGLDTIKHLGPSYIDSLTLNRSRDKIANIKIFLENAGVPKDHIAYIEQDQTPLTAIPYTLEQIDSRLSGLRQRLTIIMKNIGLLEDKKALAGPVGVPLQVINELDDYQVEREKVEAEIITFQEFKALKLKPALPTSP